MNVVGKTYMNQPIIRRIGKDLKPQYRVLLGAFESYLRKYGSSEITITRFMQAAVMFARWCMKHGYEMRSPNAVEAFFEEMKDRVAGSTLRYYYTVLKLLYRVIGGKFPFKRPPRFVHYPKRIYLSNDEMHKLLITVNKMLEQSIELYGETSERTRYWLMARAMLMLALDLGLRRKEIWSMNVGDIDFKNCRVYIRTAKHGIPKWQKISKNTLKALIEYIKWYGKVRPSQPLFTPKRRLTLTSISLVFERIAKEAGIYRKGMGWHSIRRGLTTYLYKEGGLRERELQEVLRWKSPTMPHLYIREIGEEVEEIVNKLRITSNIGTDQ